MFNKYKKIVAIFILLLSILGLASCGGSKYDPNNFLESGTEENPYQIVKESIDINIFVPRGSKNPPFKEMKMFKKLEEMTNLKFVFTEVDTSAYTQVRSAIWEDKKNLPDLFLFNNSVAEQVIYSKFNALVAFNDDNLESGGVKAGNLIDNYMPTYKELLENNFNLETQESALATATFEDGFMYSTLSVNNVPRDLTFKMFINQKWIENLREDYPRQYGHLPDAEDIQTIEEYIEILHAFKNSDPNRNGRQDEVPVTAKEMQYLKHFILASYGYVFPGIELDTNLNKPIYVPTTEAYKKYLKTAKELYTEGLIDPQVFSIKTDAQMAVKGYAGRLGSFPAAAAYLIVGYEGKAEGSIETFKESDYKLFGPLNSNYYSGTPIQWGFSNFRPDGAVIPKGTPKVREIARLLDIMYSEVGQQLIAYGEEGVDFIWDDDEKTSWTFIVPEGFSGTQEDYRATITPNVDTGSGLYWNFDFVGKMNDPIITILNEMSRRYAPYLKESFPTAVKMTPDEYNEIERINASINVYIQSSDYDFITGVKDVDTDWAAHIETLKRYSYERLEEIYQGAYERFLNNKGE